MLEQYIVVIQIHENGVLQNIFSKIHDFFYEYSSSVIEKHRYHVILRH